VQQRPINSFKHLWKHVLSSDHCLKLKGELERDLAGCGFSSLTHVRPGLISGPRQAFRLGERTGEGVLKTLGPLLPRNWRVNPADNIALALLEAAIAAQPGAHVIRSGALA